jgi:hypothetical protein
VITALVLVNAWSPPQHTPSIAAYLATTGVAGDTAFSPESGKFPYTFWQGIADGVGDQNFRR